MQLSNCTFYPSWKLGWRLTFSIPVATAGFSRFVDILNATPRWHHPLALNSSIGIPSRSLALTAVLPSDLDGSYFVGISFCPYIQFLMFSRQVYWCGLPFSPQWITFCQNSPLWSVHLGWPYMAWFIASLSYASPFTMTRQWSVKGYKYLEMCY